MRPFEYKYEDVPSSTVQLVDFLNIHGKDGWEAIDIGRNFGTSEIVAVLFKRKINNIENNKE